MEKEEKEIIKLTVKEILFNIFDFSAEVFFLHNSFYHHMTKDYLRGRELDRADYSRKIYYLRKKGYIRSFIKSKQKYIELTKRGKRRIQRLSIDEIKIKRSKRWDGKLRLVIFDIPKKFKTEREIFRDKLKNLGFILIQKSIYAHPFTCTEEIRTIAERLCIEEYVLLIISDVIQNEKMVIGKFFDRKIIKKDDLIQMRK